MSEDQTVATTDEHDVLTRLLDIVYSLPKIEAMFQSIDDLTDYSSNGSNLTEAIQNESSIDWAALDGKRAWCVNPNKGSVPAILKRQEYMGSDYYSGLNTPNAWYAENETPPHIILRAAWHGIDGWSLWIEGDIPHTKVMANELELGTCFKGRTMGETRNCILYQEKEAYYDGEDEEVGPVADLKVTGISLYTKESREDASISPVNWAAHQVEVLEIYGVGTFNAPGRKP